MSQTSENTYIKKKLEMKDFRKLKIKYGKNSASEYA